MRLSSSHRLSLVFLVLASLIPSIVFAQAQLQLHPNKTIFTPGEQIWFSAYLFDEYESPLWGNQLLKVVLLNEAGNSLKEGVFYVQDGVGFGNLSVDQTTKGNRIFLFAEVLQDEKGITPIRDISQIDLLNPPTAEKTIKTKAHRPFRWASESGSIRVSNQNTLIYQLPEDNRLTEVKFYEGSVPLDVDFESQWGGIGQFTYYHNSRKEYKFIVRRADQAPEYFSVQPSDDYSEGLRINNLEEEEIKIGLLPSGAFKNSSGQLEFWRSGKERVLGIPTKDAESVYAIPRSSLPEGSYQVRYVQQGRIRGQNWFVHLRSTETAAIRRLETGIENDSVSLFLASMRDSWEGSRLNATVIPRKAYDRMDFRDQRLQEVVGEVVHRRWIPPFLREVSRNRQARIDHWLRLYAPSEAATQTEPSFIEGYLLKGQISGAKSSEAQQVLIQSRKGVFALHALNSRKSFEYQVFMQAKDTLFATALGTDGKAVVNATCSLNLEPLQYKKDSEPISNWLGWFAEEDAKEELFLDWPDAKIALDEVVVTEQRNSRTRFQIDALTEGRIITEDEKKHFPTLAMYLRKLGYKTHVKEGQMIVLSRGTGPGAAVGPVVVPVFVDGLLSNGSDIFQMPLSNIESMVFDSMRREFLSLWIKKGRKLAESCYVVPEEGLSELASFDKNLTLFSKEYLEDFGSLLWAPRLEFKPNEPLTLRFPCLPTNDFVLVLRGLDSKNRIVDEHIPFTLSDP